MLPLLVSPLVSTRLGVCKDFHAMEICLTEAIMWRASCWSWMGVCGFPTGESLGVSKRLAQHVAVLPSFAKSIALIRSESQSI